MTRERALNPSPPGCGKSTLIIPLVKYVATHLPGGIDVAHVSLDGWHYTRAELDAMPDPEEAHWRRVRLICPNHDLC